jgi:hypothetical protein
MKLHLTGYKANAPSNAKRIPVRRGYYPNFRNFIWKTAGCLYMPEFDVMEKELHWFWLNAHGEYIAIYFWITHDQQQPNQL